LKADINKRLEEIHVKYKEPPPPKEAKPRPEGREGQFRERREGGGERPFRPREGGGGGRPYRPSHGGQRRDRQRRRERR
jgi:hypothetical protein